MEFLNYNNDEFTKEDWRSLCQKCEEATAFHKSIIDVDKERNFSIVLKESGKPVVICPLIFEISSENKLGTYFSLSMPGPLVLDHSLSMKAKNRKLSALFDEVDRLCIENNIEKITYNIHSENYRKLGYVQYNELTRFGFLDCSLSNLILNLEKEESKIFSNFTKGHRGDIKKVRSGLEYCVLPIETEKKVIEEEVVKMTAASGQYLDFILSVIVAGDGEIHQLQVDGDVWGSALFFKHGMACSYFAAEKYSQENFPIHHLILWNAIKVFKERGFKSLDFGPFSFSSQLNYRLSKKNEAIIRFKRGFSPDICLFPIGEKYFNKRLMVDEFSQRVERLSKQMVKTE